MEFKDIDGEVQWRRLNAAESGRAVGLKEGELEIFQHLSDAEIYTAVGNGVCIEQGRALGHTISKLWDADWFQSRLDTKTTKQTKQDVFCLQAGSEISVTNDRWEPSEIDPDSDYENDDTAGWMNKKDADDLLRQWHIRESKEDKSIISKVRRRMRKPTGREARECRDKLRRQYTEHLNDERCKFRRRVQSAITTSDQREGPELPEDADFIETIAGEVCNIDASIPLEQAMERKPTLPKMKDEGSDLRSAQQKDPHFGPLIHALEDTLDKDMPQMTRHSLKSEVLKYTLHGSQNVLCKVTTSDRTSSSIRVCVPRSRQDSLLAMCHDNPWACHPTADQMYKNAEFEVLLAIYASSVHVIPTIV